MLQILWSVLQIFAQPNLVTARTYPPGKNGNTPECAGGPKGRLLTAPSIPVFSAALIVAYLHLVGIDLRHRIRQLCVSTWSPGV